MSTPLHTQEGKPISFAREQRLIFIDKTLAKTGHINRSDLAETHRVATPTASRDLKIYNSLTPQVNATYNTSTKRYERTSTFSPLFPDEVKYND